MVPGIIVIVVPGIIVIIVGVSEVSVLGFSGFGGLVGGAGFSCGLGLPETEFC